jgi:2-(1,2-epoxy-1,2-dihydrophenyl)acetyl-CoA isomerase
VRVIVLTGNGGNFCTGADLKRDKQLEVGRDIMDIMQDVYLMLRHGSKPTVSLICGNAYGGGLSLALACDFLVAEENARFSGNFVSVGLIPDLGLTVTLPERIGMALSRLMLTTKMVMTAAEAEATGLIDRRCAENDGFESAVAWAQSLCEGAPLAIAATKEMLHGSCQKAETQLAEERRFQFALRSTADHAEAIAAFMGKRPPIFQGH